MTNDKNTSEKIEFVVGSEKDLNEILTEAEVTPLLKGAVRAGATAAMISDSEGNAIWIYGELISNDAFTESHPLSLEGERVGQIVVHGDKEKEIYLKGISELLFNAVNISMKNNFKRLLTTELHTTVVNQSYEELLDTNRRLSISEGKYRELAEHLEIKVQGRTEELRRAHARLLQQEKIASVGQLAAGMAHEINNPLGFILSNLNTFKDYTAKFKEMLGLYRTLIEKNETVEEPQKIAQKKWEDLKLEYVCSDVEELIQQSLTGAERVKNIVSDLRGFSHIDDSKDGPVDLNKEIDRTLNVMKHEIPEGTEVVREYHPLPEFSCNPALICQIFLNILKNSFQARREGLELIIRTESEENHIRICFSDNGPGIPEEIKNRIFEPFYTTKEVGQGKGMGLTVAHDVVTSYGGTIEVENRPETGTTVIILFTIESKENV